MPQVEYLKEQIAKQYGNISKFAEHIGVPATTIRNMFTRGVDGIGTGTMVKICDALHIDISSLMRDEPKKQLDFDDFTYALYNESRDLPEEKKQMLLEMARFFNKELQNGKEG